MVPVDFDKPRQLKYDIPALRELEAAMNGMALGQIVREQLSQGGINAYVFCLWAGFKHEDRALTPNLVQKYLTTYLTQGKGLSSLAEKINEAIEETKVFARPEDAEGNGQPTT